MTDFTGEPPICGCGKSMTWERVAESDTTGYWSGEMWFCKPCNDEAGQMMDWMAGLVAVGFVAIVILAVVR
jgi:hypothetical protein